jgi:hypothetical protein
MRQDERQQIAAKPVSDARMGTELSAKLAETEDLTAKLRATADAVAAAALSTAGQSDEALDDRLSLLSDDVLRLLRDDQRPSPMEAAFRLRLDPWLKGPHRSEPIRPFHWPLEFPEVMDAGGFSAVVSNPPFMGGLTLTGRIGEDVREYLVNYVGRGKRGSADLCSYFLLRDLSVAKKGRVGIIATNTIAQGDTREVGLDQITADLNWNIYRAEKSVLGTELRLLRYPCSGWAMQPRPRPASSTATPWMASLRRSTRNPASRVTPSALRPTRPRHSSAPTCSEPVSFLSLQKPEP